jgi:pimeloyl-ACP methyl ester carboxylesterase
MYYTAKYPKDISAIYLDAPVMNFLSCPAGIGKAGNDMMQEFIDATGMNLIDLINYRENPVDKMDILIQNNIPVIMVYGDSDDVVPYDENGQILEEYYRKNNGNITVFEKENCGHHPHGLIDNTSIIELIEKL